MHSRTLRFGAASNTSAHVGSHRDMTRRADLPPQLTSRPFPVRDARDAGVPRRRLDAADLEAPFHGVRIARGGPRLAALSRLFAPDQAFTGPTAARIWGMPLPRRLEDDRRIWVSTLSSDRAMRRPGVVASRRSSGSVVRRSGYPVLDPVRTWASLAGMLDLHDLVAAGDHIVAARPGTPALMTAVELAAQLDIIGMRRGLKAARQAIGEIHEGARSRPESLLRIALLRCGFRCRDSTSRLRSDPAASPSRTSPGPSSWSALSTTEHGTTTQNNGLQISNGTSNWPTPGGL